MLRRSTTITVSAFCALALGGAGAIAASAATTPAKGTLTACVNHVTGSFYNLTVAPTPDKSCARGDVRVRWNQYGPQGRPGVDGADGIGAAGIAGAQGEKGDKGDKGDTGAAGVNGKDGIDGKDGAAGAAGANGTNGTNGTNGKDGAGFVFVGAWDELHAYTVGDVVQVGGTSYVGLQVSLGNDPATDDGSIWAVMAAKGADGTNGKDGADGTAGAAGKDGINGLDGAAGKDGVNGLDGKDGINGLDGAAGKDGTNGLDGAAGKDGINGLDGAAGKDGINGLDGAAGKDGTNGVNGLDGKDGVGFQFLNAYDAEHIYNVNDVVTVDGTAYVSLTGLNLDNAPATDEGVHWAILAAKGDTGARGAQGEQGVKGDNGAPGVDGAQGEQGPAGTNGTNGTDGAPGTDGLPGKDGVNGQNGKDGAGFLFRSAWVIDTTYTIGDVVTVDGSSYISLVTDNVGKAPASSPLQWAMLAAQGAQGPQGEQGLQGEPGLDGSDGAKGDTGATGPSVASSRVDKTTSVDVAETSTTTQDVTCAQGSVVISGGWETTTMTVKASYPVASDTWRFVLANSGPATSVTVHVICIS